MSNEELYERAAAYADSKTNCLPCASDRCRVICALRGEGIGQAWYDYVREYASRHGTETERPTRPGTPDSLAHGSKVEPTDESAGTVPICGSPERVDIKALTEALEEAERREGETALQLVAALAHIRDLETRFTGALVPREKPERVEAGQRWGHVDTVANVRDDGLYPIKIDMANGMYVPENALREVDQWLYLGQGKDADR